MRYMCRIGIYMINLRETLLAIADAYEIASVNAGGRSLARIATIVVNRGAFFERLREGKTCTLPSFEAFIAWFSEPANWPAGVIPHAPAQLLAPLVSASSTE